MDNYREDYRAASCITVMDNNDNILLTRRKDDSSIFPRAYVMPGGHIEPGETIKQAVLRELFEECGIDIAINQNDQCYYERKIPHQKKFITPEMS